MPALPPDFDPIGRSLGRAHKLVRAWADRELAPLDASVTDFILLFQMASAPPPGRSQIEIARFSDMGGPALVRHLDRLERDGIVTRRRDQEDRRVVRVTLTDAGHARLDEIGEVMARCDERIRAVITPEEAVVLEGALQRLFEFAVGELQIEPLTMRSQP